MKVIVAKNCGFCHGVKNAIGIAEKVLTQHRPAHGEVYSLGPIIHNKDVVERLAKAGLKTVTSVKQIPPLTSSDRKRRRGTVLIRSHGAAPEQIAQLKEKGLNIVDATCVLVKRVQRIAKSLRDDGYKVVVIGDENHPEVQAVVGSVPHLLGKLTNKHAKKPPKRPSRCGIVVIADESDLHKLPKNAKLGIVCQTTQSHEYLSSMLAAIGRHGFSELKVINTLCKEAIKRQQSAVKLCKKVDVMFVLGGLESANTRRLADLCKKYNSQTQTFHLQNWNEFDKYMVFGKKVAGVTAGASTPEWIIAEFVENLTKW